jgi:hypothetical protein
MKIKILCVCTFLSLLTAGCQSKAPNPYDPWYCPNTEPPYTRNSNPGSPQKTAAADVPVNMTWQMAAF